MSEFQEVLSEPRKRWIPKKPSFYEAIEWTETKPEFVYTTSKGRRICGAKRRGIVEWGEDPAKSFRCLSSPTPFRCPYHGGSWQRASTPIDPLKSKFFPAHLRTTALRVLNDPNLTSLREEIAIQKARLEEILILVNDIPIIAETVRGESRQERLRDIKDDLWKEYDRILEDLRKLAIAEQKRESDMQSSLNAREAYILVIAMQAALDTVINELTTRFRGVTEALRSVQLADGSTLDVPDVSEGQLRQLVWSRFDGILRLTNSKRTPLSTDFGGDGVTEELQIVRRAG